MTGHLDQLRDRGWRIYPPNEIGFEWLAVRDDSRGRGHAIPASTPERLVDMCAVADGLPTERERVLEDALCFIAGEYGIDLTALPFEALIDATSPDKENP